MSDFATEYLRVKGNIEDAYTQAALKGATLPVNQNSDNLPSTIATITGGGDGPSLEKYYVTQVINGDECELQLTSTNPNNNADELLVGQYVVDDDNCKLYLMEE